MGRDKLTFSSNGYELPPLPKEELKPLSGSELVTLSRHGSYGLARLLRVKHARFHFLNKS